MITPTTPITERDMLNLLLARYNSERRGTLADRYVRAEHVRSTQFIGRKFISVADFMAIDKYATTQSLIGHEVKVSRSDWLTELRDLSKAERIKEFCNYWYLVISDTSVIKDGELPNGWGLMVKSGTTLRVKIKAPLLTPVPLTLDFAAGLAAAVQRTAMREPLRRDARTITLWNDADYSSRQLCQGCGELSPCPLHQPRKSNTLTP